MTDMYMEQRASKKKYLIPLVVLLLCAVSLTGAGYAYNASITNDGNEFEVEGVSMNFTDEDGNVTAPMFDLAYSVGSHTTSGKAWDAAGQKGLTSAGAATTDKATAADGYYMKVLDADGNEMTGATSAIATFNLDTENNAKSAVTLTMSCTTTGTFDYHGKAITQLYIEVTDDDHNNAVVLKKTIIGTATGDVASFTLPENAGHYTVKVYSIGKSYVSADAVTDGGNEAQAAISYTISFVATTA